MVGLGSFLISMSPGMSLLGFLGQSQTQAPSLPRDKVSHL